MKPLDEDSAGLIVDQVDNYADRPWCSKEIRAFLKPVRSDRVKMADFLIMPSMVVTTFDWKTECAYYSRVAAQR